MSKERTDKSRYKSKYTDKWVSEAQIVAEYICERLANKNKSTLPYQFWKTELWAKEFLKQLALTNRLLKKYHIQLIWKALKSQECNYIISIGSPTLKKVIEKMSKTWINPPEEQQYFPLTGEALVIEPPRPVAPYKQSIFDKLEEL